MSLRALWSDLRERVLSLVRHRREERELEEELRFHLQMEEEQNRRHGLDAGEARRRSFVALGGVERTKEAVRDARGTRLLEDSAGDFFFTLRTLARSPGFTAAVVLTLAIGIGGTTAVFSVVDAVLLQPLPYQQPGQLVRLYQHDVAHPEERGFVTPVHYLAYRSQLGALDGVAATRTYDETGADIGGAERPERIRLLPVSADYFGVVRVSPQLGRAFSPDEENGAAGVVLSHQLWERQFNSDPAAVGRTMSMNAKPYVIVGVMPKGFVDPIAGGVDGWVPLDLTSGKDPSNVDNHWITVVARLRSPTTIGQAQAELDALGMTLARQYPNAKDTRARFYPLKEDIVGSSSLALELMLGAVGLVLVLVCVNVANLLLVRGSERAREFAVRSALGAERPRLMRQLLVESLTLAFAGDVAGLIFARVVMSGMVAIGAGSIPRLTGLTLEPSVLAFSVAIASLSALLFGLAPALRAARTDPSDVLRGEARGSTSGGAQHRLRTSLVISQVALAFVLLTGSGLLLASFQRLRSVDLGVKTDRALAFELHLPGARYDSTARGRFYDDIAERMKAVPGVRYAGGISKLPATGDYHIWGTRALSGPFVGTPRGFSIAQQRVVSGDYFKVVGIPIIAGRAFDQRDDAAAPRRFVISEGLAQKLFPGVDPIGQQLRTGGRTGEIIGVVPDVAVNAEGRRESYVYHAHRQFAGDRNWSLTQLVLAADDAEALEPSIRRTLAAADPELVMYRPMTLAAAIGEGRAQRVFTLRLLTSFAAIALAVAALGLFGVLSYTVKLRSREFGIRIALGAEGGAIRRMVLRQGIGVTAVGVGVGCVGAIALTRVMRPLIFHVSPLDPRVMVGAVLFMGLVAGLAAYLPARRATVVDPRSVLQ